MNIEIKNINKSFKKKQVLNGISSTLTPGVYGLLGPNGAGKTTLLRCMTGIYNDYKGEVLFDGKTLLQNRSLRNEIGYLPQKFDMFKELSLYEMMCYFASLKHIPKKDEAEAVEKSLTKVNLWEMKDKRCGALSGGMIRRAGIAQAVLGEPSVIIVDEPTAGLDPEERIRFKNIISSIGKDCVVLLSTHIVEDVEAVCDRIIIMNHGDILYNSDAVDVCKLAEGKVYEMMENDVANLKKFEVIRTFRQGDTTFCRVITSDEVDLSPVLPTVEDGYLCAVKGMA